MFGRSDKFHQQREGFGVIFNAYCKLEQEMITCELTRPTRGDVVPSDDQDEEIEFRLERLNRLIERILYLLHQINLRKNPNNIR